MTPEFEKRLAEAVADHDKVVELLTDPLRIKDLEMHTPTHLRSYLTSTSCPKAKWQDYDGIT